MKTLKLNWGYCRNAMSPNTECMVAVGTLRRREGTISGVDLKFHRRISKQERLEAEASRCSCHKTMVYKIFPDMKGEWVVINLIREIEGNRPATVIIQDMNGNVAGNADGCGMNVWGGEIHSKVMNMFMGREAFINMSTTEERQQSHPVRAFLRYKVRDARTLVK